MRFFSLVLVLVCSSAPSIHGQINFKYVENRDCQADQGCRGQCVRIDSMGVTGYNSNIVGECGQFSNVDLRNVIAGAATKNLTGARFIRCQLPGEDLSGFNLKGVIMLACNVSGVNFTGADMSTAYLKGSDLSKSKLDGAKLTFADLTNVDLTDAGLSGADLTKASLQGAILQNATFNGLTKLPFGKDVAVGRGMKFINEAGNFLDPTFGQGNGYVRIDFGINTFLTDMQKVAGGKILICGYFAKAPVNPPAVQSQDGFLIRLNADGSFDDTFGNRGLITFDIGEFEQLNAFKLQGEKIVVVGQSTLRGSTFDAILIRFNANGALDLGFGSQGNGFVRIDMLAGLPGTTRRVFADALFVYPDNSIGIAGHGFDPSYSTLIAQFSENGILRTEFGNGGIKRYDPEAGGKPMMLRRKFDNRGRLVSVGTAMLACCLGHTLAPTRTELWVSRLNTEGEPDPEFGNGGYVRLTTENATTGPAFFEISPTNQILISGIAQGIAVQRHEQTIGNNKPFLVKLLEDGRADPNFGLNGFYNPPQPANGVHPVHFYSSVSFDTDDSIVAEAWCYKEPGSLKASDKIAPIVNAITKTEDDLYVFTKTGKEDVTSGQNGVFKLPFFGTGGKLSPSLQAGSLLGATPARFEDLRGGAGYVIFKLKTN